MLNNRSVNLIRNTILPATLNSYSVIFFFNNRLLASVVILVSFFNFFAGLSGLFAALVAILVANSMGFDKVQLKKGLYSFNALLTGIGMGTFFDPSWVFFSLLILASLLSLILSVTLGGWLHKYGLPFLSIPFVTTFWFITLTSSQFENLGLTQRNIYWMNEVYAIGGNSMLNFLQTINSLPVHKMVDIYLRSMSSIIFQDNLIAGLLIAVVLLICSRIAFSLSVFGFVCAYLFAKFSGSATASITYYNIGANYIMVAISIGGFFVIPSKYSYLWTIILIPLTSLVLLFMNKLLGFFQLAVFSLPFSFIVILFMFFLKLRTNPSKLVLTPIQYYSPEINLYTYNNNKDRLSHLLFFPLHLPFWGDWTITQGYDGKHTHIGDWGKALDFMLFDNENKPFKANGLFCENYYSYNMPVLAPANGVVEEIIDNIDDNEIGKVNTTNNWGNTIIIRHLPDLYTQLSHLKKGSFKVAKGNFVKQGEILALCGNSGRSPAPHLHYQVQITPLLGSRTLDYPISYYYETGKGGRQLHQFSKPSEGALISGVTSNLVLNTAFDFTPNSILKFTYLNEKGIEKKEQWDVYTDSYNYKYLYCEETGSCAYYVNDGSMFYFTAFYGRKDSLLYYFYLSVYKVFLGESDNAVINDLMPLNIIQNKKISIWLHDFIAPFLTYIRVWHSIKPESTNNFTSAESLILKSKIEYTVFGKTKKFSTSMITLKENSVREFSFETKNTKIEAKWLDS
jgi:urea transporter/murein DD-endopeptidase MepM/ murein hydrolase activator NlpD